MVLNSLLWLEIRKQEPALLFFGTTPETPEDSAARNARKAHMEWEVQHRVDPYHSR